MPDILRFRFLTLLRGNYLKYRFFAMISSNNMLCSICAGATFQIGKISHRWRLEICAELMLNIKLILWFFVQTNAIFYLKIQQE